MKLPFSFPRLQASVGNFHSQIDFPQRTEWNRARFILRPVRSEKEASPDHTMPKGNKLPFLSARRPLGRRESAPSGQAR
jgi:hypothetical protein